ncbi:MAG: ArnT family glycosyltransferase [Stellaceae bacterium]
MVWFVDRQFSKHAVVVRAAFVSPDKRALLDRGAIGEAAVAVALLSLALLCRLPTYNRAVVNWDESLYMVMASQWLGGGLPYVAVWDHHPVGVPALFAAAQWLFGPGIIVIRLMASAAIASTAYVLYRFLRSGGADPFEALAAGGFYIAYTVVDGGLAANTEIFFLPFVSAGFLAIVGGARQLASTGRLRVEPAIASGLAFGIGLQCKYVIVCEVLAPLSALLLLAWPRGVHCRRILAFVALFAVGLLLPTVVAAGYFARSGHFAEFFYANILANMSYVTMPAADMDRSMAGTARACLASLLPMAPLITVSCLAIFYGRRNRSAAALKYQSSSGMGRWIWLWLAAATLDVISPWKFFDHYFIILAPPLSLLAATSLSRLGEMLFDRDSGRHGFVIGAFALVAFPTLQLVMPAGNVLLGRSKPEPATIISRHISAQLEPGAAIYVDDNEPVIYYLTGAKIPTRFPFDLTTAYSRILPADAMAEIHSIFDRKPQFVVRRNPLERRKPSAGSDLIEENITRDYRLDCVLPTDNGLMEVYLRGAAGPSMMADLNMCR